MREAGLTFFSKSFLLLLLSAVSASIHADKIAFCSNYAQGSVRSHIDNLKSNCDYRGKLWSPGLVKHQKWCLSGNESDASDNAINRAKLLEHCGREMKRSQDWDDLDFNTQNMLFGSLIMAVAMDDVASLKIFESAGVNLNFEWRLIDGGLLFWAIKNQASQVAHYLVEEKSANPNLTSNGGPNPLVNLLNHAPKVNYRLLDYLLRKGARPNHGGEEYSDDSFPLTTAASNNDLDSVRLLLKYSANANLYESVPPLMMAIYNNNSRMVDLLLSSGAKPNRGLNTLSCQKINQTQSYGDLMPMDAANINNNNRIIDALLRLGAKTTEQCLSGS